MQYYDGRVLDGEGRAAAVTAVLGCLEGLAAAYFSLLQAKEKDAGTR